MPTNHFPFVGTHFKTGWESKGMANSFGPGASNRGGERPVGWGFQRDSVSLAVVSKGGSAALAGGIQRRAEPSWREESNETGGFVAHDFAGKV